MKHTRRSILRKVSTLPLLTVGASGIATAADCGGVQQWDPNTAYTGGTRVVYNNILWEAEWWTRGREPAASKNVWTKIGECGSSGGDGGDGGNGGSDKEDDTFAPYEGTWGDIVGNTQQASTDHVIVSFIGDATDDGEVNPGWLTSAGQRPLTDFAGEIQTLQNQGIEVTVAIGGWHGRTVARDADNATELMNAYEKIINTLGVSHIDIDDENAQNGRPDSVYEIRNEALALLQEAHPDVTVSYTVPAGRNGIENRNYSPARDMVSDAVAAGVDLEYVNIMTMGFNPTTADIIRSAGNGTVEWLGQIYPGTSVQERWEMLGVTPNIGESGFTTAEARDVAGWAEQQDIGLLSFWALYKPNSTTYSEIFYDFETS
jgi:hypothetical protein